MRLVFLKGEGLGRSVCYRPVVRAGDVGYSVCEAKRRAAGLKAGTQAGYLQGTRCWPALPCATKRYQY